MPRIFEFSSLSKDQSIESDSAGTIIGPVIEVHVVKILEKMD